MSEQRRLAEKAASMARSPFWQRRHHDHLVPKKWPLIPQALIVKVDE